MLKKMNDEPHSTVCLDASVVVRWLLGHDANPIEALPDIGRRVVAPSLMRYEVTNAIYQAVKAGGLTLPTAIELIDILLALPIEIVDEPHLHGTALTIAQRHRSGAAYDAHYVALAQHLEAELWTADKRLYHALHPHMDLVRLVTQA
jgi:predicted nucleic acid-binding protein